MKRALLGRHLLSVPRHLALSRWNPAVSFARATAHMASSAPEPVGVPDVAEESTATDNPAERGSQPATSSSNTEPGLPDLTPSEFKEFNRMAEQMDYYHTHFRQTWNLLHNAAVSGRRPANMTLKQFLDSGLSFVRQLTMHHDIEETYLYPLLAVKMPQFRHSPGGNKKLSAQASELIRQHREIHAGMDHFEEYLRQCRNRELDLEMGVLREKMDSWGTVLWTHMDQEVRTLGADNMRRYWTLEEMRRLSQSF